LTSHGSIRPIVGPGWQPILQLLREWVYADPKLISDGQEDAEVATTRRRVAGQMLQDVAEIAAERPGVQQELKTYAQEVGATIPNRLDPDFERGRR
jgi:hypothetical protein